MKKNFLKTSILAVASFVTSLSAASAEPDHTDTTSVVYDAMRRPLYQFQGKVDNLSLSNIINNGYAAGAFNYTYYEYDALGRVTNVRVANLYDASSGTGAVAQDSISAYVFDDEPCSGSGKVCAAMSPDGAMVYTNYDALDRVDEVRQEMGSGEGSERITKTFYDTLGRVEKVMQGFGTSEARLYKYYTYTASGQIESVMDANCNVTLYTYDGYNRLSAVYFPPKDVTVPDPDDNMGSGNYDYCFTNQNANVRSDIPGVGEGSGDREEYYYDADGNMLAKRTRRGDWINYSYDALNQRTEVKTYVGGSWSGSAVTGGTLEKTVTYSYYLDGRDDVITQTAGQSFGDAGNYTVPQVTLTYAYDTAGRPTGETITYPGDYSRTVAYDLDEAGNRTAIAYPGDSVGSPTIGITYDERGLFDVMTIGSHSVAYSYDGFGRRMGAFHSGANGMNRTVAHNYYSDNALKGLTYAFGADSTDATQQDVTFSFGYNTVNQLKSTSISNLNYVQGQTAYEQVEYVANGLNQYEEVDGNVLAYDASGNLTDDGDWLYTYDVENRLVKAKEGVNAANKYQYGPKGRRLIKETAHGTSHYMYDGDEPIADYETNTLLRHYVNGAGIDERVLLIDMEANKPSLFYHANHQGSIIAMSCATTHAGNPDGECGTGEHVQSIITYDAYGNMGSDSGGQDFRYTGRRYDEETGLYYYRARYYSARLGRFMQTDPIGYEDNMNLYGYTANDPVNFFDPNGLEKYTVSFVILGGDVLGGKMKGSFSFDTDNFELSHKFTIGGGLGAGGFTGGIFKISPSSAMPATKSQSWSLDAVATVKGALGGGGEFIGKVPLIAYNDKNGFTFLKNGELGTDITAAYLVGKGMAGTVSLDYSEEETHTFVRTFLGWFGIHPEVQDPDVSDTPNTSNDTLEGASGSKKSKNFFSIQCGGSREIDPNKMNGSIC